MKIQALYDLQQEINRLFIAGSKFASGDPRLTKLVPVFEKMGEKAPVFKKIAADVSGLTKADSRDSSARLLALGSLLYSILYTQGEALEEGAEKREQKPALDIGGIGSAFSFGELRVTRDFAKVKSNRMEYLEEAYNKGIFKDFRTFSFVEALVEDKYTELADLAAEVFIPAAGPGILPILLKNFEYDDKAPNVRRLKALIALNAPEAGAMVERVYNEDLPKMQVAAMPYLAREASNEGFLLELAKDKKKEVREAALGTLVEMGNEEAIKLLREKARAQKTRDARDFFSGALRAYSGRVCYEDFLADAANAYAELAAFEARNSGAGDPIFNLTMYSKKAGEFFQAVKLLERKDYPETTALLSRILADESLHRKVVENTKGLGENSVIQYPSNLKNLGYFVVEDVLRSLPPASVTAFFEGQLSAKSMPELRELWLLYLEAAPACDYNKARIYEVFCPAYERRLLSLRDIMDMLTREEKRRGAGRQAGGRFSADLLDERWLDKIYPHLKLNNRWMKGRFGFEALVILNSYEPLDSRRFNDLLLSFNDLEQASKFIIMVYVAAMRVRNLPGAGEQFFKYCMNNYNDDGYFIYSNPQLWDLLTREQWLELKAKVAKKPDYYMLAAVKRALGEEN